MRWSLRWHGEVQHRASHDATLVALSRPAARVNDLRSSDLIVGRIPIRLEKIFERSQKLFRSIPSSAQTEVEYHRSSRSTVLPQIGLMVLTSALMHLHIYRRFIGLDVGTAE